MGDQAAARDEAGAYDKAIRKAMRAQAASPRVRFSDPALEREFRRDYAHRSLRQVRISLVIGGLLYALFGLLDPWVIPDATSEAWLIRYAVVCPIIVGIMVLSFRRSFPRYMQASMVLMGLAAGLGITAMIMLAVPPGNYLYYAGLLLVCTFV
ncbi:MAG TPA: hypothetical protein VFA86_05550, partial [Gammaproteobacteria bacterium]|nr:hypothetical protein [Gammaproteobacteria bacterium]